MDSSAMRAPSRRTVLRGGSATMVGGALTLLGAPTSQAYWPTFTVGTSGNHVYALQGFLNRRRYWCGTPDGYFGDLTQQAVWALQKAGGLTPDAIVGRNTLKAISNWVQPVLHDQGSGTRVAVDLAAQLLTVTRDGVLQLTLNTSTGNGEPYDWYGRELNATTPPGAFEVFSTYSPGWQTGPLGELYRPQYFNGGIAVHGSDFIPPYPDSHGCCRVSVAAMDMLWDGVMTNGTPVTVV